MTQILTLDLAGFSPEMPADVQDAAVRAIEGGGVVLPRAVFVLSSGAPLPVAGLSPTAGPRT